MKQNDKRDSATVILTQNSGRITFHDSTITLTGTTLATLRAETKKTLRNMARLRRTSIQVAVNDPSGQWHLIISPDGSIHEEPPQGQPHHETTAQKQNDLTPAGVKKESQRQPVKTVYGKTLVGLVAVAIVFFLVTAAAGAFRHVTQRSQHYQALAQCLTSQESAAKQTKALQQVRQTEQTLKAKQAVPQQVRDPKTIEKLQGLLEQEVQVPIPCKDTMPTAELLITTTANQTLEAHNKSLIATTRSAVVSVLGSREVWLVGEARGVLAGRVGEASALLASSDGRVADGRVRTDLTAAIDAGVRVRDDAGSGLKELQDASQALVDAMGGVNESMRVKAEQEALEASAPAPTSPPTPRKPNTPPNTPPPDWKVPSSELKGEQFPNHL